MSRQPRPNPICSVCRRPILPGAGRTRRGLTSTHVECEKTSGPTRVVSAEAGEAVAIEREDTLRLTVCRKLAAGSLPHNHITRFWGGPSNGEECDVCETAIRADQLLMECISTQHNQGLQFHVECFYIWDSERDVPGRRADVAAEDE
jgi:hypothetical protein